MLEIWTFWQGLTKKMRNVLLETGREVILAVSGKEMG